jgi:hypothetical protein
MTDLRAAAQQALEALETPIQPLKAFMQRQAAITALRAALAEPVQEPPCATRECMPSQCPNCVSLQNQNTELDRKLADLEQTSLELCNVCGWRTLIPGDCCLNCERKHPLGQASTDVPLTVYSVKKAEPVQEPKPVAWSHINGTSDTKWHPPQRPVETILDAAVLTEREACAKVCETYEVASIKNDAHNTAKIFNHCAAAIRARGQQ